MVAKLIQEKSDIKQRLEQMTQDFHFDMRNKHMEETILKNRIDILEGVKYWSYRQKIQK